MTNSFDVLVEVSPLATVADPQGTTVERALATLGFAEVEGVRIGRAVRFRLTAASAQAAEATVAQMCDRLLVNSVIEQAHVDIKPAGSPDASATR